MKTAEQKLAEIAKIFNTESMDEDGNTISTHAGDNLEGALIALKRNHIAGWVTLNTLERISIQLAEIGKILGC
jgi:hypothetical protein